MDSYRMITVDVPESPISSGARGPWLYGKKPIGRPKDRWIDAVGVDAKQILEGFSTLKAGGPHAIQGKWGMVKTPLTSQE